MPGSLAAELSVIVDELRHALRDCRRGDLALDGSDPGGESPVRGLLRHRRSAAIVKGHALAVGQAARGERGPGAALAVVLDCDEPARFGPGDAGGQLEEANGEKSARHGRNERSDGPAVKCSPEHLTFGAGFPWQSAAFAGTQGAG